MKVLGWLLSAFVGAILLMMAWNIAFPPRSDILRDATAAATEALGGAPDSAVEYEGIRSNAVCGNVGEQRFVFVNERLHSARTMPAPQFAALEKARCQNPPQ